MKYPPVPPIIPPIKTSSGIRFFFSERVSQSFDSERRVAIHFPKSSCVSFLRSVDQFFVRREFRQQSVNLIHEIVAFSGSATNSRVSEIEIIGTNFMKRNSSVRNRPTLPKSVIQSHLVG